ncbi:MAG: hypothetical protein KGR26_09395, partial [Cyanobacteria bacterium REEB65]|nr:hypothetical protein [Cyanobacteria bacterium REEB65]
AGMTSIIRRPFDLGALVSTTVASFREASTRSKVQLTAEIASTVVNADETRIRQVLDNLIANALKFTPPEGTIAVSLTAEGPNAVVKVADSGPGIATADQSRIFEVFQQADMTSTRRYGGVGLGLAICKSLIEGHGGQIGVSSEPGAGSTFWFTLPSE